MTTQKYAVTFEFDLRPPLTAKGQVSAGNPATAAARAVREAKKAVHPMAWRSMVVLLYDRAVESRDAGEAHPA